MKPIAMVVFAFLAFAYLLTVGIPHGLAEPGQDLLIRENAPVVIPKISSEPTLADDKPLLTNDERQKLQTLAMQYYDRHQQAIRDAVAAQGNLKQQQRDEARDRARRMGVLLDSLMEKDQSIAHEMSQVLGAAVDRHVQAIESKTKKAADIVTAKGELTRTIQDEWMQTFEDDITAKRLFLEELQLKVALMAAGAAAGGAGGAAGAGGVGSISTANGGEVSALQGAIDAPVVAGTTPATQHVADDSTMAVEPVEAGVGGTIIKGAGQGLKKLLKLFGSGTTSPKAPAMPRKWTLGKNHSETKWSNQLEKRGWTREQIDEAVASGRQIRVDNKIHPKNGATRYEHPKTKQSVVLDDTTNEVIHVGGPGFHEK